VKRLTLREKRLARSKKCELIFRGGRWPRNPLHFGDNRGQSQLEAFVAVALQHGDLGMLG
jgi:hypothetical protein